MVDRRYGSYEMEQPDLEYREQIGVYSGYCATCDERIDRIS